MVHYVTPDGKCHAAQVIQGNDAELVLRLLQSDENVVRFDVAQARVTTDLTTFSQVSDITPDTWHYSQFCYSEVE